MTDWIFLVPNNVGDGVVGCGDGRFCCYGQGGYQCCSTPLNSFSLGVGTYLNSVTAPSPTTIEITTQIANPTTTSTTATASTSTASTSTTSTSTASTGTASTSTNTSRRTSSASTLVLTQRTSTISSTSTVRSTVAPSSTPPSPTPKAGVHQYVAVGVGIGVAVGLVILGGCAYFLLRRSRRTPETRRQPAVVPYVDGKSEMDAVANRKREHRNFEIMTHRPPIELDGRNEFPELSGSLGSRDAG